MEKENGIICLKNENPTEAEKELFRYAGFYPVEQEDLKFLKYAVVYPEKNQKMTQHYPTILDVSQEYIDWDSIIIFESLSESVNIKGYIDMYILSLIVERTKELEWKNGGIA